MTLAFRWDHRAALDVLSARASLGVVRAEVFDTEIERVRERLCAMPYSAPRAWLKGAWSETIRKLALSRSPYHLFYVVDVPAGEVVVLAVQHEKQAPPKL